MQDRLETGGWAYASNLGGLCLLTCAEAVDAQGLACSASPKTVMQMQSFHHSC
jgi:hypothetical protein